MFKYIHNFTYKTQSFKRVESHSIYGTTNQYALRFSVSLHARTLTHSGMMSVECYACGCVHTTSTRECVALHLVLCCSVNAVNDNIQTHTHNWVVMPMYAHQQITVCCIQQLHIGILAKRNFTYLSNILFCKCYIHIVSQLWFAFLQDNWHILAHVCIQSVCVICG